MEIKRKFKSKKSKKPDIQSKDDKSDRIVYRDKQRGPKLLEDWQLKLKAIRQVMDEPECENVEKRVNEIFEDLKRKQG